jgi:hypothetical protein
MKELLTGDPWSDLHETPAVASTYLSNEVPLLTEVMLPSTTNCLRQGPPAEAEKQTALRKLVLIHINDFLETNDEFRSAEERSSYNINQSSYNHVSGVSWGPDADPDQDAAAGQYQHLLSLRQRYKETIICELSKLQYHLGDESDELIFLLKLAACELPFIKDYNPWKLIASYSDETIKTVVLGMQSVDFLYNECGVEFLKNKVPPNSLPERVFSWLPAEQQNLVYAKSVDVALQSDIDHDLVRILFERCGPSILEHLKEVAFSDFEPIAKVERAQELLRLHDPEYFSYKAKLLNFSIQNITSNGKIAAIFNFLLHEPKKFPELTREVLLKHAADNKPEYNFTAQALEGLTKLGDPSVIPYLSSLRWSWVGIVDRTYRRNLTSTIETLKKAK